MNYFTTKKTFFLVPPLTNDGEFKKIDKFLLILEKSGVGITIDFIYKKDKITEIGRKKINPFNMFATIIYCFAKFKASLREIEELCKYDIRVIYLMEQNTPTYATFCEFINKYIVPYQYEIFTKITSTIINEFELDVSDNYLDGTKIEANANKYKFVWKPTKYHNKLDSKIKNLLKEMDISYDDKKLITAKNLNDKLNKYAVLNDIDTTLTLTSNKGKRLSKYQKNYKIAYKYLTKLIEYEEKEAICGELRNSFYKTDIDATAMMLKEDYYSKLSHDFHAAYNIQVIVSAGLIMIYGVFQDRNDYYTFIPMNDLYFKYYGKYPKNECDDSGYGIYSNYKYMQKNNIGNYVKFQSWKGEASGKRPQLFYTFSDGVMCLNTCIGEIIKYSNNHQKKENSKLYKFTGCNHCNYAYKCKEKLKKENKDKDYRIVELNTDYELLKEQARVNLLSPKGIEMRINRSIQVEGTFGQIKQNMQYIRIRRRGLEKVSCELMLVCLGRNIRKLFSLMNTKNIKSKYWEKNDNLKEEKLPIPKQKKKGAVKN